MANELVDLSRGLYGAFFPNHKLHPLVVITLLELGTCPTAGGDANTYGNTMPNVNALVLHARGVLVLRRNSKKHAKSFRFPMLRVRSSTASRVRGMAVAFKSA